MTYKPHYLLTTEDITKLRNGETVHVENQYVVIYATEKGIAVPPGTLAIHLTHADLDELLQGHRVSGCGIRINHGYVGQTPPWDH